LGSASYLAWYPKKTHGFSWDYIIIVVVIPIIVVIYGYMLGYISISGWWYTYPSEK
jgi:hypothetical protein